jgi:hypothetical protein
MARIRAIKPGFFQNEDLAEFSFAHRLLFAGLWTQADKQGRLEDRPKRLKAAIFPYDDGLDIHAMLDDLSGGRDPLIVRYEVDGLKCIWIRKFREHQRPHHTEPESELPAASEDSGAATEKISADTLGVLVREGNGVEEGNGVGESATLVLVPLDRVAAPEDLRDAWNTGTTAPLPKCSKLTPTRRQKAQARLKEAVFETWVAVIARINASAFCRGETERGGWIADFDWLLKPDSRVKVMEGKFDNRKARGPTRTEPIPDWTEECDQHHATRCESRYQHGLMMDKKKAS